MKLFVPTLLLLSLGGCLGQNLISQCPQGWLSWQTFCYLFDNSTKKVTWDEADDECTARLGHKLRIETADEYEFVKKGLLMYASSGYWTDLNDLPFNEPSNTKNGNGVFMWGGDEPPSDDVVKNHWDHEPDNTDFEDCVHISTQATLSVQDCSLKHGYICQIRLSGSSCPPNNWYSDSDDSLCFFISNVTTYQQLVTWDQARKTCEAMAPYPNDQNTKAQMLAITSSGIQAFLEGNMGYYGGRNPRQVYWTALNDKNTEGKFIWAGNDGTPFNQQYIKWRVEPNNLGGQENCGALLPHGEWSDRNCEDHLNFACRIALPSGPQEWNQGCGQWLRAGRKCVYVYSTPRLDRSGARTFCQKQGGDLMKFDNEDDVLWVKMIGTSQLTLANAYYIGLNDLQTENTFLWADGSWAPGYLLDWDREPNNFRPVAGSTFGQDEDCAMMGIDGFFTDRNCRQERAGSICEDISASCKVGWQPFNGHCYFFDTTWRTRPEARENCATQSATGNGLLFSLSTQAEKDWLVKQIKALSNAPYFYWSNLGDWKMDGDWHWGNPDEDDPVAIQSLVTWQSEPNNWGGNEDCVTIAVTGRLNDVTCDMKAGFLCQRSLTGGSGTLHGGMQAMLLSLLSYILLR